MQNEDKKRKIVDVEMSIHPEIQDRISKFQKECLDDEIKALPPIKEGDVNVSTDYIFDLGDKYEASIFFRNGSSKSLILEKMGLLIVDSNKNQIVGRKLFELREVGEIPPYSVRPWKVYFDKEKVNLRGVRIKDLKIELDTRLKAEIVADVKLDNLPEEIQGAKRREFDDFSDKLPLLKKGEFSISSYDVKKNKDGGISVTIIMRNGTEKSVKIEKVPVSVSDKNSKLVASAMFYLDNVVIDAEKAKVYNFSFLKEEMLVDKFNLEKYDVDFKLMKESASGGKSKNEEK